MTEAESRKNQPPPEAAQGGDPPGGHCPLPAMLNPRRPSGPRLPGGDRQGLPPQRPGAQPHGGPRKAGEAEAPPGGGGRQRQGGWPGREPAAGAAPSFPPPRCALPGAGPASPVRIFSARSRRTVSSRSRSRAYSSSRALSGPSSSSSQLRRGGGGGLSSSSSCSKSSRSPKSTSAAILSCSRKGGAWGGGSCRGGQRAEGAAARSGKRRAGPRLAAEDHNSQHAAAAARYGGARPGALCVLGDVVRALRPGAAPDGLPAARGRPGAAASPTRQAGGLLQEPFAALLLFFCCFCSVFCFF